MSLQSTHVSKSLDRKLTVWGYEIPDLFLIFLVLSLSNYIFAAHAWKFALSWGPSIILAVALRYFKRGKPEKYLEHRIKSALAPKYLSSFPSPKNPVGNVASKKIRIKMKGVRSE